MLTGESAPAKTADLPALSQSYAFDAMGNRTQWSDGVAKTLTNAVYNRLNQLTGTSNYNNTTPASPVLLSTSAFGYDGDGNMTNVATTTANTTTNGVYRYDDASRLIAIESPGVSKTEFFYDGKSRLRVSRTWTWQNGAWVPQAEKRRVYVGMDVVQERDGSNAVTASYTRGGNIAGILARTTPIGSSFYDYDGMGNVTTLTDAAGAQVGSYTYDAWGNTIASSGAKAGENPYRFSTKESIGGLYSYGYRFYSPGLGRWINRDPIGEWGGVNLYLFVANNPTNGLDSYGYYVGGAALVAEVATTGGAAAAGPAASIFLGAEAANELRTYTPLHPTGPFTSAGEGLANGMDAVFPPTTSTGPTFIPRKLLPPTDKHAHEDELPTEGPNPYIPPKKWRGKDRKWSTEDNGFVDDDGRIWKWDDRKCGNEHWDVTDPKKNNTHINVNPKGAPNEGEINH